VKNLFFCICFLIGSHTLAATSTECLNGNFNSCLEIFNKYGSQSDKKGAVELFTKACTSETLNVSCRIVSVKKSETMGKVLEMGRKTYPSGSFVMSGQKFDKIYQISEIK